MKGQDQTEFMDLDQSDTQRMSMDGAKRMRSVVFRQDDIEQTSPSLPVHKLIEELQNRHGKSTYFHDFAGAVNEADENGDGLIAIPELMHVIENMQKTKKENKHLKKYLGIALASLLLVLVAIFGLVFAVVKLTQEVSTGGSTGNALVSKSTGIIVDTHPSDGGGIYLSMAAFTEPINITFPSFDKTQECVGQVSVDQVNHHYAQFTTGGSTMTISYIDYSQDTQPAVYAHIPASNLEVTGFGVDSQAGFQAEEGTQTIIAEQMESGLNRKRRLNGFKMPNAKEPGTEQVTGDGVSEGGPTAPRSDDTEIKGRLVQKSGDKSRRLRAAESELVTVDDYMRSFSGQTSDITFIKDHELSEEVYYVCHAV